MQGTAGVIDDSGRGDELGQVSDIVVDSRPAELMWLTWRRTTKQR